MYTAQNKTKTSCYSLTTPSEIVRIRPTRINLPQELRSRIYRVPHRTATRTPTVVRIGSLLQGSWRRQVGTNSVEENPILIN